MQLKASSVGGRQNMSPLMLPKRWVHSASRLPPRSTCHVVHSTTLITIC